MRVLPAVAFATLAIVIATAGAHRAASQQALASPARPLTPGKLWSLTAEPFTPPGSCPELARRQTLYRVCDDQRVIFRDAVERARRNGKLVLVTFGATWCPSCRAFSTQLEQAANSDGSAASRFTRVEIAVSTVREGRRVPVPTGQEVLNHVLATASGAGMRGVPFIAVIDPNDASRTFARNLDDAEVASGDAFDLERLGSILAQAGVHVRNGGTAPSEPGWLARKLRRWFSI